MALSVWVFLVARDTPQLIFRQFFIFLMEEQAAAGAGGPGGPGRTVPHARGAYPRCTPLEVGATAGFPQLPTLVPWLHEWQQRRRSPVQLLHPEARITLPFHNAVKLR